MWFDSYLKHCWGEDVVYVREKKKSFSAISKASCECLLRRPLCLLLLFPSSVIKNKFKTSSSGVSWLLFSISMCWPGLTQFDLILQPTGGICISIMGMVYCNGQDRNVLRLHIINKNVFFVVLIEQFKPRCYSKSWSWNQYLVFQEQHRCWGRCNH